MESLWHEGMKEHEGNGSDLQRSSSDEESETHKRGGSRPGRAGNIEHGGGARAKQLNEDYFSPKPV